LAGRRYATTVITDITLTLARLTATTDLIGSLAECSSAPVPGMAGDMVGAAVGATVFTGVAAGATVAVGAVEATMAARATVGEATAVDFVVTGFTVAMASTEAQAEVSTVGAAAASTAEVAVAVSTGAAGGTVADTGNLWRR
jgi:hypothetical protein